MTVSLTGVSLPAVFGTIRLTRKPVVRYAYQGLYSPAAAGLP
jgi:hypothetical protein